MLVLDLSYLILRAVSGRHRDCGRRRAKKILAILKRDNMRCVLCGSGEYLTIDHINGRKEFKHDNHQKYKLDACQTLCKKCHTKKNLLSLSNKKQHLNTNLIK